MSGLQCYENEEGEVWVPVESEPDEAVAGQRYADERGLAVVAEGQVKIDARDCECIPTRSVVGRVNARIVHIG